MRPCAQRSGSVSKHVRKAWLSGPESSPHLDPELLGLVDRLEDRQPAIRRAADDLGVFGLVDRPRARLQSPVEELVERVVLGGIGFEELGEVDRVGLDEGLDMREGVRRRVKGATLLDALLLWESGKSERASTCGIGGLRERTLRSASTFEYPSTFSCSLPWYSSCIPTRT